MITLNANGLDIQLKTEIDRVDKRHDPIICFLQAIHFKYNNIGRFKVNKWENIPYKHQSKGVSCINIRQSRLQSKEYFYGMRRTLYNNKRINLSRRHLTKCICTKQQRYKICEAKLMK